MHTQKKAILLCWFNLTAGNYKYGHIYDIIMKKKTCVYLQNHCTRAASRATVSFLHAEHPEPLNQAYGLNTNRL